MMSHRWTDPQNPTSAPSDGVQFPAAPPGTSRPRQAPALHES